METQRCYHPELEHARCDGGHPIHYDNSGRYDPPTWTHCLLADVVACRYSLEDVLSTGYVPRHDSGHVSG